MYDLMSWSTKFADRASSLLQRSAVQNRDTAKPLRRRDEATVTELIYTSESSRMYFAALLIFWILLTVRAAFGKMAPGLSCWGKF